MKKIIFLIAMLVMSANAFAAKNYVKDADGRLIESETVNQVQTYKVNELVERLLATDRDIVRFQQVRENLVNLLKEAKKQGIEMPVNTPNGI